MSNTPHDDSGEFTPAAAFAAIGNEIRLRILHELWEGAQGPIGFAELRKRVGMRDSGQFNYHLEKLVGPFIEKTDEGYLLRVAGAEIVWAVMMETYGEPVRLDPFEIPGTCVACKSSLQARYDDGMLFIECSACKQLHEGGLLPAVGFVGRTNEEAIDAFHHGIRAAHALSMNGVCWGCDGEITPVVKRDLEDVPRRSYDDYNFEAFELGVKYECEHCTRWGGHAIGLVLLFHPVVIAFHYDHGIDLTDTPYWELDWCVSDNRTALLSEDPWLAQVSISLDDEELQATIDDELTITGIERVGAGRRASDGAETTGG